ncbi:MAG: FKBP-type peptidyl-prolyl cis-trans isomerase [Bacteroidaceae bacterium]|nr:FKBP-type peptidyl-prolyl cis-trans isomerase [Bacteroidaceae bacterium]
MKRLLFPLLAVVVGVMAAGCSSDTEDYDPYYDWEQRNAAWYEQIADSARTAIAAARAEWGEAWADHCSWRMYKSLLKSQERQSGILADSICVRIITRGTGTVSPHYDDSVRVSFRGWLMPTTDARGNTFETVFTQTYYGDFDPQLAAPNLAPPSAYNDGFATAVQYMVTGDDWMVYIPQQLFYGAELTGNVQPYSTVRMRIHLAAIYPRGTTVPEWKAPRR